MMEPDGNIELKTKDWGLTIKKPRRILHFSDGTLEEYSDTEEPNKTITKTQDLVDTMNMGWGPWLIHKAVCTGNSTLAACDYVGEALASFLGITTPKYQYELDEYMRLQKERNEIAAEDCANGWLNSKSNTDTNNVDATVVVSHPTGVANSNLNK